MTIVNAVDDVDLERDRSLVLQAQAGDDAAFAALYARYFRRLVRFAAKRVGNPTEAEEIAQEAFTRAYRALPNFSGDRRFYPWLCVITGRLCVDSLRREGRCQVGQVADEPVIEHGYERLEKEGEVAKVVRAMGRLSTRHREVLDLRERQGWSYQHIAAHYEVSLGTVEALLWRARRALKREYEGLGALALSIPGVRRVIVMWRNHNSGQAAVTASAFGTIAVLGMAAGIMGSPAAVTTSVAAYRNPARFHVATLALAPAGAPAAAAAPAAHATTQPASVGQSAQLLDPFDMSQNGFHPSDANQVANQRQPIHVSALGLPVGAGADPDAISATLQRTVIRALPVARVRPVAVATPGVAR